MMMWLRRENVATSLATAAPRFMEGRLFLANLRTGHEPAIGAPVSDPACFSR